MSSRIRVQLIHFEYANHAHTSSSTFSMKFSPCHVLGYLNAKGQGPVPEIIYWFAHFSTPWQWRAIIISLNLMRINGLPLFQDSPQIDNWKHFLVFPCKLSLNFSLVNWRDRFKRWIDVNLDISWMFTVVSYSKLINNEVYNLNE